MVTAPDFADAATAAAATEAEAAERGWLERAESLRKSGTLAEAIRLGEKALASAERRGDARMQALSQLALANYHRYVPNSLTAIQLLNCAEAWLRAAADPRLAKALTFKGMVLSDLGDHTRAIDLYRDALDVMDLHRNGAELDLVLEATCHGAIGIACTQLGEFGQAEEAYLRALGIFRAERNAEGMGYLFNNLAILRVRAIQALPDRGEAAAALGRELFRFIDDGLEINERSVGSVHLRALLRNTRGDGLRALGRAADALPDLEFARAAYQAMDSPRGVADLSADFGAALLELGRNEDALVRLGDGLAVALAHELKDHQRRLRKLLADAHERAGDPARALAEYKAYHMLERELHDRDTQKKLQQLALREEIDRALAEAREQSVRSAELTEQNETLRRQTEALDRIAYEDALTGLANRRRFEERAAALPAALPESFAVAVLDIDFFKRINDTWSHPMGDAVLQAVGAILRAHCREQDLVARIGGEEFVLAMHGVTPAQAAEACERVREAVASHPWQALQNEMAVTISIGLASGDGQAALGDLLKTADQRLYAAKRGGRNRVVST